MTDRDQGTDMPGDRNLVYSALVGLLVRPLMDLPPVYSKVTLMLRGKDTIRRFVDLNIRPEGGERILDIGCGTGDILDYLPAVDYSGFDLNGQYIRRARKRFGNRGRFFQMAVNDEVSFGEKFDIVLAMGILHHLNDDEARHLFTLAARLIKPGGRILTFDGCYTDNQSAFARFFLGLDRGKYVRDQGAYEALARHSFSEVRVRYDRLAIPYTIIVMECRNP